MNKLLIIAILVTATSCVPKKTVHAPVAETDTIPSRLPPVADSIRIPDDPTIVIAPATERPITAAIPDCIQKMISDISNDPVQNPPRKIFSYTYKGQIVYYLTSVCCDQYSNLYNDRCELLGHPDGGFTGRGDGKFPNFQKEAINEKLVWADKRK